MPSIQIRVEGDKKVIKKIAEEFPARLRTKVAEALVESAGEIMTAAIPLTPYKTFALRRSIRVLFSIGELKAAVVAGGYEVPYAKYQEFGTYANRIDENNISAIRAALRSGYIPKLLSGSKGISPRLFLHRGAYQAQGRIQQIFALKVQQVVREINT